MRRAVKHYTVLLEFLIALGILPGCVWSVPMTRISDWAARVATRFSNGSQEVCIMAGLSKPMMSALLVCISYATFVTTVADNNRRVLRRIQVYR